MVSLTLLAILSFALPVHAAPATEGCVSCHSRLPAALQAPVKAFEAHDVHQQQGCVACHGGDPATSDSGAAHKTPTFVGKPKSADATVAMCGRCHEKQKENFLKSPHHTNTTAKARPDCSTCHGAHGIERASLAIVGEPLCSTCHSIDQARRISKALGDAEREVTTLQAQLASAHAAPAESARLDKVRAEQRGLLHSLNLLDITRAAANTLTTADEIRARVLPGLRARDWAHWLIIAGAAAAALMFLLAAYWAVRWLRTKELPLAVHGKRVLTIVAVAAALLATGAAVAGFRGYRYIAHDPKFCLSCHTMNSAFARWEESGHKNVQCHACHAMDPQANLHQVFVYVTKRPDKVVKHAEVDRKVCETCHTGGGNGAKQNDVIKTPGHALHVGKERIECVQCHATTVHRFKPPKDLCVTCHRQITLAAAGTMAEMHCLQCHSFLAGDPKRQLKPDRAVCLDCHAARQVKGETYPAKAPMTWDCGKCHKPHEKIRIGNADCKSCHNTMTEGVHRVAGHESCLDCHKPHGWSTTPETCATCHAKIDATKHHAAEGKSCKECHGAWDDEFQGAHALNHKK